MTPNEITTLIASNLEKELDFAFKKQLYERVKYWRSTLIKQTVDRSPQDAKFFKQTIYLKMEKIDASKCAPELCCFAATSLVDIPKSVRTTDAGIFMYLGSIDGGNPFGYADTATLKYLMSGKYGKLFFYYRIDNNRPFITQVPEIPILRIDDVFEDPEEAMKYASCDTVNDDCDFWNEEIPGLSQDISQRIVQSILSVDYNRPVKPDDHQIQINGDKQ